MPYPESCPECGGAFRNTGTHFTARRNEIGRHVLLELGCQNTTRRFWWDFTTGSLTEEGRPSPIRRAMSAATVASTSNGVHRPEANGRITEMDSHLSEANGHMPMATLEIIAPQAATDPGTISEGSWVSPPETDPVTISADSPVSKTAIGLVTISADTGASRAATDPGTISEDTRRSTAVTGPVPMSDDFRRSKAATVSATISDESRVSPHPSDRESVTTAVNFGLSALAQEETLITDAVEFPGPPAVAAGPLKDAFVRQLQLDRLTLRQMRSWLMSDEARRAIEVAAGATEATYERLALILFGVDLPLLLGKQAAVPASTGMSAEERLELQREKARIRARLRRAATKAARLQS
jgi:hypothetical protein